MMQSVLSTNSSSTAGCNIAFGNNATPSVGETIGTKDEAEGVIEVP